MTTPNSIERRLTELVLRRYELEAEISKARNKLVTRSLKRELRSVGREAQRYTSEMMSLGFSNDVIATAVREGMPQSNSRLSLTA